MRGTYSGGRFPRLPTETNEFIGRAAELRHIDALLRDRRLVTLIGPGGVGKTRVALRAAAAAAPEYHDVCMVELSALRDPALLAHTVARRLDLSEHARDSQREALLVHLSDRRLLLVLDNCEHLIDACAELAGEILLNAPTVTVLATSREPLDVDGETIFPVGPLPVTAADGNGEAPPPFGMADSARGGEPDGGARGSAGGDAVELFARRAAAAVPGFTVTPGNLADVITVCRRLDGMPLAIELAAVRLRALPLAELATRLGRQLPLLAVGDEASDAANHSRHRTLRDAIRWSYDLCTDAERTLWARLSVFSGAFSVAAAQEVCAGAGLDFVDVFQTIIRLVDKSVLVPAEPPAAGGDEGRTAWYRMLDTIHEFGADMLGASGEQAAVRMRFIARYLARARYFAEHLTDADQLHRFRELRRDHSNLRAALQYTLDAEHAELHRQGAELGIALSGYWAMSGLLREGRYWLAKVLDRFPGPSRVRGWALACRCYLGAMQGAADEAVADGTAGTEIGVARGDQMLIGRGYAFLTLALAIAARYEEAHAAAATAEQALDAIGDRIGLGTLDAHLAHLSYLAGDPEATLRYTARGLGRLDGTREWWSSGWLHAISAMALYLLPGRDAETARAATRSLLAKYELGDIMGMAYCLEIHGWLAARAGRQARAAWLLGAAGSLWLRAGGRLGGTAALEQVHADAIVDGRAALGGDQFDALFADGSAAPLIETVAFAVADADVPGGQVLTIPQPHTLTDREWEIAYLAGAGLSADQIAGQLFLSTPTIEDHLASAFRKLGISAADQLRPWLDEQLTPPGH